VIGELARFDETGLFYRVPDPTEEQIDALDPGTAVAAEEEANYFKSRAWTGVVDGRECRCIEFRTSALTLSQRSIPRAGAEKRGTTCFSTTSR
jgi:hypothetical protein